MNAALEALAAKSDLKIASGTTDLTAEFGVALHVGPVAYGNIGAPTRLDFTVIGPAVNMVSRIAGLCGQLDRPILASSAFSRALEQELAAIGSFELKGIESAETIYGLPEVVSRKWWKLVLAPLRAG